MPYDINVLGTGSSGNAILIDDEILIDIGLGYRTIKDALHRASAIFVTHEHGDHLNMSALKGLIKNRPAIVSRGLYLNEGTRHKAIEKAPALAREIESTKRIKTGDGWSATVKGRSGHTYEVESYKLAHDVENQGFIITKDESDTLIHATDTQTMKYAPNRVYDYLLIEGNWDEDKFMDAIQSDDPSERFRATHNLRHLSVQSMESFVRKHSHENSVALQLHESMEMGSKSLITMNNFTESHLKNDLDD